MVGGSFSSIWYVTKVSEVIINVQSLEMVKWWLRWSDPVSDWWIHIGMLLKSRTSSYLQTMLIKALMDFQNKSWKIITDALLWALPAPSSAPLVGVNQWSCFVTTGKRDKETIPLRLIRKCTAWWESAAALWKRPSTIRGYSMLNERVRRAFTLTRDVPSQPSCSLNTIRLYTFWARVTSSIPT